MLKSRIFNIVFAWVGGLILIFVLTMALQVNTAVSESSAASEQENSSAPSLQFTKTVGLSSAGCASTDTIQVLGPTTVVYCYAVKNTGDVTFTRNTLFEEGLGPLLNNIFLELSPGEYTYFTVTAFLTTTTVTTASWDAYDVASYTVTDTTPYNFIDISSFGTPITVGPNGSVNIQIPLNFNVQIYDENNHHLRLSRDGVIRQTSFDGGISNQNTALPVPGFKHAFIPFWDNLDIGGIIYNGFTGTAPNRTWIVQWDNVPHFPVVGDMTFQIQVQEGVGSIQFHYKDVVVDMPAFDYGRSATIGLQKNLTEFTQYAFNTQSLTNEMAISFDPIFVTATDQHSATVIVKNINPDITLTATVGATPGVCASNDSLVVPASGGDAYYCYEVMNSGNVSLTLHDLDDTEFGSIFASLPYTLAPGDSIDTVSAGITLTKFITETTINNGTWNAYNPGPIDTVTAADSTTVSLQPAPAIELTKTVGFSPDTCADSSEITVPIGGQDVYYCYEVTNTGNITLSIHTLNDDLLGNIFDNVPYDLGPGDSVDTVGLGITATQFITQDTVNTGLWLAYNPGPTHTVTATAVATTTLDTMHRLFMPSVQKSATTAAGLLPWFTPLAALLPTFGLVLWRRKRI